MGGGFHLYEKALNVSLIPDLKLNIKKNEDHGIWSHNSMAIEGEIMETVTDFISWPPKSLQMVTAAMKLKDACSLEEKL